ncbi:MULTISPECIES: hypothetical protein [unclassified Gemella]|uniref:hypothetical protein n=1 Tax=unclassified Gemella TaxID=2624949 RepID=UPI00107311D1|nr:MULTISPECIES: hypothetical protein [unclassified Gemella]MBF0710367.1 hypothetical protein [Gemella sp. GL1.1]MBF0747184.1 hypothetical protein [Gemella sp. 19428wG2_WT2a]NYS27711.1 hypothetical protein [Gemella sp. GL1]TFU58187.1 hypothetical protein E4T67_05915 [Gemella sp. WT2a]
MQTSHYIHTQFINGICINTVLTDLKSCRVRGCTVANEDGSYTIFLNSKFSTNQLEKTYLHEIKHITRDDFSKDDADRIELVRH